MVITRPITPAPAESFHDLVEAKYLKYKPCIEGADKKYPRYEHGFRRLCQLMFPMHNVQEHVADKTKTLSRARDAAARYGFDFQEITYLLADSYLHSRAVETVIIELLQEQRVHEAKAHEAAEDVAPMYSHTMEAYNYKNYIMALFEQGVGWDGTKLDGPKDDPSEDNDPERYILIG